MFYLNDEKNKRIKYYLFAVRECFDVVAFSGNYVRNILESPNHIDFHSKGEHAYYGHINWYYLPKLVEQYHGNVCIAIYNCSLDINKLKEIVQEAAVFTEKDDRTVISKCILSEEAAAVWTREVLTAINEMYKNK